MQDFSLIESDLSQSVSRNGAEVRIRIYRQRHEREWSVEVIEGEGLSVFHHTTYASEQVALKDALRALQIAEAEPRRPVG